MDRMSFSSPFCKQKQINVKCWVTEGVRVQSKGIPAQVKSLCDSQPIVSNLNSELAGAQP